MLELDVRLTADKQVKKCTSAPSLNPPPTPRGNKLVKNWL